MKKNLLVIALIGICFSVTAQVYNNEWIDYNKTYYKFSIGTTGLCRILQPALSSAGLGNVPIQNFQLWHNGTEVPLYTSVTSGTMGNLDFLEFYGVINDGQPDTKLYRYDSLQMNSKWSLYTDTSAYYLTVNTTSVNKRYSDPGNNVAGNVLPVEPYFMYTLAKYYKDNMSMGYGIDLGELVHSASYETGEGWASGVFGSSYTFPANNAALNVYTSGPSAKISATVAGNASASRTITLKLNGTLVASKSVNDFNISRLTATNIALSSFTSDAANLSINHNGSTGDNIIVADYQITYPRKYNFGAQSQFSFELPAGAARYIEVANFISGANAPVLYDLANNFRITGVVAGGLVKFVLPASSVAMKLVLLNTTAANIVGINNFTQRNFVNYSLLANQGDYVIISHTNLFNDGAGNDNVDKYRQYRRSAAGGAYNAIVVNIDQLIDQFAFGIKHHPSSIRNFAAFALARFTVQPKYFYLIGKGVKYSEFRKFESDRNTSKLALVPTFGNPASDNLLVTTRLGTYPLIPIGRLSAVNGAEVGVYLDKIKQFELAQTSTDQSISGKGWMKNIAQITGGLTDPGLAELINTYMDDYKQTASDSLFGGDVFSYRKNSGLNTAAGTNETLEQLFTEGLSMLTYFGHSSPNAIEFNLDNPENYNNTGKYPLIMINGCNSGDLFVFDTLRAATKSSLSEKFVFAEQKGSIAYIASTHLGLPTQLNYVNADFYNNMCNTMYGQPVANIMKATMQKVSMQYPNDYIAQTHAEEITLHGDPAIRMNPHTNPDYVIEDDLLTINPSPITMADYNIAIKARIVNVGKVGRDSVTVRVERKLPDSTKAILGNFRIGAVKYTDSISIILNLNPSVDTGTNEIIITIDPDNLIPELSESNNSVSRSFSIVKDEIRPVFPYEYAIVHNASQAVFCSTADAVADSRQYVMEMDTTEAFNSAAKVTKTITDSGGIIKFVPGITYKDSTVYYWRVAAAPTDADTRWLKSSFVYINGGADGYNQSHYYQYKKDEFAGITIDSASQKFGFGDVTRKLLIRTGLYPYYLWDQINVNIDNEEQEEYGCWYGSLQIMVYDPVTLTPWKNVNANGSGRFGSWPVCSGASRNFFEFPYADSSYRRKAMQFLDSVPAGYYVSITNLGWTNNTSFAEGWKADTSRLGSGKSLWHKFHSLGMDQIDSFTKNLPFAFVYRQGDTLSFPVKQFIGPTVTTQIVQSFNIPGKPVEGTVTSPWFGPVNNWYRFKWDEKPDASSTTKKRFDIIGKDINGFETPVTSVYNSKDTSIAFIDAGQYPYIKLRMYNKDSIQAKTIQPKYWMVTSDNVPEGAVSPNMIFSFQDSLTTNDTLHFRAGFVNISNILFDSIRVRLTITDKNNVPHVYNNLGNGARIFPMDGGDSVVIAYDIPMAEYFGQNQLVLEVNPDDDQPELFHYNNYIFKRLTVINPLVCPGSGTSFSAGTNVAGNGYQWQVDNGTGYTNIVSAPVYAGVTQNTLVLNAPPTTMYGYKYRCRITNGTVVKTSPEYELKFSSSWTGATNSSWNVPGNWSCNALPDDNTDVIINANLPAYPVLNGNINVSCRSIRAKPGTSVIITGGSKLTLKGKPGN